ncbi:hypothetical protein ABW19_dt0205400 [Dactylella cylindrospora]|nr:hypothetical protein ABW19_dt0205400 [Dactylella cylindrospora]
MLPIALVSAPLQLLATIISPTKRTRGQPILLVPFFLWLGIFSLQPHKEERFMYPAYPALSINAAISLYWVKYYISAALKRSAIAPATGFLRASIVFGVLAAAALVSTSRIVAVTTAYEAPKEVYNLQFNLTGNVCFGKEWYRFPSSFFLPDSARPRFIKSAFAGLLPGQFPETNSSFREGTWRIPENMNDLNQEDHSKYIPISDCDFLVDSYFEGKGDEALEPNYVLDTKNWKPIVCKKFLDASNTPFLSRALWLPPWIFKDGRVWGEYCILQQL